jgi:ABC-type dipeptide/oligopeptide/nickel transport system ATPase component
VTAVADLLRVKGLCVEYRGARGIVRAVDDVSFTVCRGEIFGLVGESGSGKSTVVRTLMRLLPSPPSKIIGGSVLFEGEDLLKLSPREIQRVRGAQIGMVFQDPQKALNPVMPIGEQIAEGIRFRERPPENEIRARVIDVMTRVGIPDPARRWNAYPHELSGGQRQRVVIAAALLPNPKLLFADEPTTALDVTIQNQILQLLTDARDTLGMSVVLVTHDLGVVAQTCRRVAVMHKGRIVEQGLVRDVFSAPNHPYTKALLAATRLDKRLSEDVHDG